MILTGNWNGETALTVDWGGTSLPCDWIDNNQAHVTVPAGTAGSSVSVAVVTPAGTSNPLTYFYDSAYFNAVATDAPLSWWRLDEAAGASRITDKGSLGVGGTVNGGVTFGQTSALPHDSNTSALFDGSSGYIEMDAHDYALTDLTLEAWIKTTDASASRHRIWSQNDGGQYIILSMNGGLLEFCSSADGILTTHGGSIADGAWHHLALVRDTAGLLATWYVDGVSVGTEVATATAYGGFTTPATISRYSGAAIDYVDGTLDEVAVYGTALSATRIAAHYAAR